VDLQKEDTPVIESKELPADPQTGTGPGATAPLKPTSSRRTEFGAAALAILFYALLVDATVETFLSGSPVRWWTTVTIAGYAALTIAIWRAWPSAWARFDWGRRATASLFLVLGLLAVSAWLPGGLSDGVTLLRQPMSTVLSLVTAFAIALAAFNIIRFGFVPLWPRLMSGLLAAYGVTAFVIGIKTGASYSSLFHGLSVWSWLPFWLQGAFVGALVVVPAGLIARVARTLRFRRSPEPAAWEFQQLVALAMSLLMAVSAFAGSARFADSRASAAQQLSSAQIADPFLRSYGHIGEPLTASSQSVPLTPAQAADRVEKLFAAFELADREIPRDTFDVKAVVDKVGHDPTKLFEWVRDNTYFVPYRGMLRGETGVLMDRFGNSLDRAVLLYALLGAAGQRARLAQASLSEQQARDILSRARGKPAATGAADAPAFPASAARDVDAKLAQLGIDRGSINTQLEKVREQQLRVSQLVAARVSSQAAAIAAAVGPQAETDSTGGPQIEAVRDHWWVECDSESGWLALDPTFADAHPGQSLGQAQRTIRPERLTELGAENLHVMQLRFVIETWKDGRVHEAPVLTRDLLPAALIGQRITLSATPVAWPGDLDLLKEKNPTDRLLRAVLDQHEWLPVLDVGGQQVLRYSFNDYGDLGDTTLPSWAQTAMAGRVLAHKTEEGVRALGGQVGGMLRRSEVSKEDPPSRAEVTAAWIDYEVRAPGQAPRTIRREVFDLLGPAARASTNVPLPPLTVDQRAERCLALMGETEILPLVAQLSPEFAAHALLTALRANREVLPRIIRGSASWRDGSLSPDLARLTPLPSPLYGLALARQSWNRFPGEVYLDRPNILSFHSRLRVAHPGDWRIVNAFDIVANDVAARVASNRGTSQARLAQGVLDTNAEAFLASMCGEPSCGDLQNTSDAFAARTAAWTTIKRSDDPALTQLGLSKDTVARIRTEVAAGFTALVPDLRASAANGYAGWWRVSADTGETIGIGDRGWGQSATEKNLIKATQVTGAVFTAFRGFLCAVSASEGRHDECVRSDGVTVNTGEPFGQVAVCVAGGSMGATGAVGGVIFGTTGVTAGITLLGGVLLMLLSVYQLMSRPTRGGPCPPELQPFDSTPKKKP
jgi:hypothetical protein